MSNLIPKHVLLVSDRFPPSVGGLQAAGKELAVAFSRMGFRVSVATATEGAASCGSYEVFRLGLDGFGDRVLELAERLRPDVLFLNGHTRQSKYPVSIEKASVPVVFRSHGIGTHLKVYWNRPPFFGMASWFFRMVQAVRNAREGKRLAQEVFLDSKKGFLQNSDVTLASVFHPRNISFIPNAFSSFSSPFPNGFRLRFGLDATSPMFLCVANYSDLKGQELVVDIIRRNPALCATFVFVGTKANEVFERAKHRAGDDSRIKLLVGIPRTSVMDAVTACDVAFLFSTHEQQPLFLSEAMSCGKPWFCTNVGSVSKMKGGIVLRRRNESSFVDAVKKLLSADNRRTLGAEGRAFWKANYSPDVVYDRWKRLLNDVIAGRPGRFY